MYLQLAVRNPLPSVYFKLFPFIIARNIYCHSSHICPISCLDKPNKYNKKALCKCRELL